MTNPMAVLAGAVTLALVGYGCDKASAPTAPTAATPEYTASSGGEATQLGRTTFGDPTGEGFKAKRVTGAWQLELEASPAFDLSVQRVVLQPGGQGGWRRSSGMVFIQVLSGTVTFYRAADPDCKPVVRKAGQGFFDRGQNAHLARNESGAPATTLLTFLAPPGAQLRIDADAPKNCHL